MNIGAGRIVPQDAVRINDTIADGRFGKNPAFLQAVHHVQQQRSQLHLMGLLTGEESGHAYPKHLTALLQLAHSHGVPTQLHLFTDGRDSPKFGAIDFLHKLEKHLGKEQRIATVIGRIWMDRAKRWSRTETAYNALVLGKGRFAKTAEEAVLNAYQRGESDEFLAPTVIGATAVERRSDRVRDHDALIFFNLRSDRARQITKAFVQHRFEEKNPGSFRRQKVLRHLVFVALTEFGPELECVLTAFPSVVLEETLPVVLGNLRQLYLAESEKFAHVTYFFNGGHQQAVAGEERRMVSSADVPSFDAQPAMAAPAITAAILDGLARRRYDCIVANFANADMVGHTGNIQAGITAVQCIDACVARIASAVIARKGLLLITGDHGNIEEMVNEKTGAINTEHSGNPVPFIIIGAAPSVRLQTTGVLADVAPTLLALMGRTQPHAMTGHSLLR